MTTPSVTPDLAAIKQRQQATWASGDYAVIGTTLQIVGETLAEAVDLRAGERVLDVAAGNGNATLAAARRFADVTSTDYVPALLDKGRAARARRGPGRALPGRRRRGRCRSTTRSFDVVLSTFGVMFAPDQRRAAREMLRVVRAGGRIGLANWTPEGFIGRLFKMIGAHVPPPAGREVARAVGHRGAPARAVRRAASASMRCERRHFNFRYRSAAHWSQVFRDYYGPTHKAFAALDAAGQQALERDITALLEQMNIAGAMSLVVPSEYLEVVITKR